MDDSNNTNTKKPFTARDAANTIEAIFARVRWLAVGMAAMIALIPVIALLSSFQPQDMLLKLCLVAIAFTQLAILVGLLTEAHLYLICMNVILKQADTALARFEVLGDNEWRKVRSMIFGRVGHFESPKLRRPQQAKRPLIELALTHWLDHGTAITIAADTNGIDPDTLKKGMWYVIENLKDEGKREKWRRQVELEGYGEYLPK